MGFSSGDPDVGHSGLNRWAKAHPTWAWHPAMDMVVSGYELFRDNCLTKLIIKV